MDGIGVRAHEDSVESMEDDATSATKELGETKALLMSNLRLQEYRSRIGTQQV